MRDSLINFAVKYLTFPTWVRGACLWITNRCNLKCKMCLRSFYDLSEVGDMSIETFTRIANILRGKMLVICGNGEPLLHPQIFDFLRFAKERCIRVNLTTNGTLLTEPTINFLLTHINKITFSIDGTEKVYRKIRAYSNYQKVLDNIERLQAIKKGRGLNRPDITFNFVGMRENIKELPGVLKLAASLGVKEVVFFHPHAYSKAMAEQHLHHQPHLTANTLYEAKRLARELSIKLIARPERPSPRFCTEPFVQPYITPDGSIYTCCFVGDLPTLTKDYYMGHELDIDPSLFRLGHIDDFRSAWIGSRAKALRHTLLMLARMDGKMTWSVKKYIKLREIYRRGGSKNYCKVCQLRFSCAC